MAIFNSLAPGRLTSAIDRLVDEAKDLSKPLMVKVKDLACSDEQLTSIISEFPAELRVETSTNVNGLAAFEAMYFSIAREVMGSMLAKENESVGVILTATMVVMVGVFGDDNTENHFLAVSQEMLRFAQELSEAA